MKYVPYDDRILISVIICTYNRADLLADVLKTVCEQTLERSQYEVIVVDNNSSDETAAVSHAFAARYPNMRYCMEPQQGLSHARNRGWQEARGEYVGYIDDDCKVPEGWLAVAKEVIERVAPDVFGGPYFAFYNTPKPAWFKDEYASYEPYAKATLLKESPDALHGGNLFLRRELLKTVGGFNPELGMVGGQIAYGEETALLLHLHATRPSLIFYYESILFVYHLVRPEKMTFKWRVRERFVHGRYAYRVMKHHGAKKRARLGLLLRMVKSTLLLASSLTIKALFRERSKYPYIQSYWYEPALKNLFFLGSYYEEYQSLNEIHESQNHLSCSKL